MKLCYVANSRFPSERAHMTQMVHMCNAFAHHGCEVTLVVTNRESSIEETPEVFFGTPLNFSVVRVPVPDIAGRAIRIPPFFRPYAFFIQRLVFAYRAVRFIKQDVPTHIYGRDEWILWLLSFFVSQPIVWESHEARYSFAARRLLQKPFPLVVISEGIRDFYLERGVSASRIHLAHDAVDDRFFAPHLSKEEARSMLGITGVKPVAMYIGGFDAWKGVTTLFEASRGQDVFELWVIGGKEAELAHFKGQYPFVHFLGPRPYRLLPQYQQAADVLVIPNTASNSVSALYTSPLKLFAHMTSERPIVASRIPSLTHILKEEDAFLCIPDDATSLRAAITEALLNPEEGKTRARRAYEKSRAYTWNNRASAILAALKH